MYYCYFVLFVVPLFCYYFIIFIWWYCYSVFILFCYFCCFVLLVFCFYVFSLFCVNGVWVYCYDVFMFLCCSVVTFVCGNGEMVWGWERVWRREEGDGEGGGAYIYNNPVVWDIEKDFQETLKQCCKITQEDLRKRSVLEKIAGKILRLIAPLM